MLILETVYIPFHRSVVIPETSHTDLDSNLESLLGSNVVLGQVT